MEDIAQLRQLAIARLSELPPSRLVQALDFIDFLLERSSPIILPQPEVPQGRKSTPRDKATQYLIYGQFRGARISTEADFQLAKWISGRGLLNVPDCLT